MRHRSRGFTLIELLLVIVIIATLAAIVVPQLAGRVDDSKIGAAKGQIAAFEPSYVDWVAATITRDPGLVAAARVIQEDLDLRGVVRRRRAGRVGPRPPTD